MSECKHKNTHCINEYELIRKYRCVDCGAVMMCACNEIIGKKFLPHQLFSGNVLETQENVIVTNGFVSEICTECRNLPVVAYPVAAIPGRTSKIKRYYWRELAFREMELYEQYGGNPEHHVYELNDSDEHSIINKAKIQALKDIKKLHETTKKYEYKEKSTAEIIEEYNVEVVNIFAEYRKDKEKKARVRYKEELLTVEKYVETHLQAQGYQTIFLESIPFHALFSIFMWIVIQDPHDSHVHISFFGERSSYEKNREKNLIWVPLPDDFGTPGYNARRTLEIERHFASEMEDKNNLLWIFDYWVPYSEGLRQYLWAHHDSDIQKARKIVEVLSAKNVLSILKYLTGDYWGRYLGWPDLLAYRNNDAFFVEVKSSKDKLSEEQKRWIAGNYEHLHLPFKIYKVHQKSAQQNHST
jgi:hypothetical protein